MLTLDGSRGEGGGQILRTALALAAVTGKAFHLENIRARRSKPGLQRQHLTSVNAAAEVCRAEVQGAEQNSQEIWFYPGEIVPGDYHFTIGTAGSTTLVLQTVLPPLLLASAPSTVIIEGGTHNTHAPPADFVARAFLPLINRMGPHVTLSLERYGFYPAGGGRIVVQINPCKELRGFDLTHRGPIQHRMATAIVAGLSWRIAVRELAVVADALDWPAECLRRLELPGDHGQGNVLLLEVSDGKVTEIVTGFGERGVRAEEVARNAVEQLRAYLEADVPVGHHLADQLLLPLSLAGYGSFVTTELSLHATTNIDTICQFLDVETRVDEITSTARRVAIQKK